METLLCAQVGSEFTAYSSLQQQTVCMVSLLRVMINIQYQ